MKRRVNIPAARSVKAPSHHDMAKKKKRAGGKQRRCAAQAAANSLVSSSTTTSSVPVATTQAAQVDNPDPVSKPAAQVAAPAVVVAQPATTPKPTPTPTPEVSEPTETPASAAAASSSGGGSGGLSAEQQQTFLTLHNNLRAQHGAAPLTWSDTLASAGLSWANGCVFEHSQGSLGPYGENLAAGTGDSYDETSGFEQWAAEESKYSAGNPQASHYTQIVWKGSQQLGCGMAYCAGLLGGATYFVCEYFPAGNVIGEFGSNVQ